jgi:SAM-dependent methyltransferase
MEEKNKNSYFIDPESGTELVRLIEQDSFLFELMKGPFPAGIDLDEVQDILDVACGPGSWALRVATTCQDKEIIGIDISKKMLDYARICAQLQHIDNLQFLEMDVLQPLDFADETFDLVNARLINAFLKPDQWSGLITEFRRITHPGGYLCLTESVAADTNSPAFEELYGLIFLALHQDGRPYFRNSSGRIVDAGEQLPSLLTQGGWQLCETRQYQLDWSWGAKAHPNVFNDGIALSYLLRPLVVTKMKLIDGQKYDLLCNQLTEELSRPGFEAIWTFQSAYGQKPR